METERSDSANPQVGERSRSDVFEVHRGRLFGLAYRMLGSRVDAEDVVQDTFIRWHQNDQATVRSPEAWLVTTATRLAIDRLRALKTEREAYKGPWLPEPIMTEDVPPPDRQLELASDLSVAFLVLLERLAPEERAAFLLHDVFDCGYGEIARTLGKSEAACRQMVSRARERVRQDRKRFDVPVATRVNLLRRFTAAFEAGDEATLLAIFSPDATWTADGGGRTPAAARPLVGADRIVTLLRGLHKQLQRQQVTFHLATVGGEAGLCIRVDGRLTSLLTIDTDGERIAAVYAVLNPDKLGGTSGAAS